MPSLETILAHLYAYPEQGYWIAFSLAFFECVPLFGWLLPGFVTMPPIGWLIATAQLPALTTFTSVLLGGLAGDGLSYALGLTQKRRLTPYLSQYRIASWVTQAKQFIKQYGVLSVVIGKFIGPMRSSIPLCAGLLDMNIQPFLLASIGSVTLWSCLHLAPGFLLAWFGITYTSFSEMSDQVFLAIGMIMSGLGLLLLQRNSDKPTGNQSSPKRMIYWLAPIALSCSTLLTLWFSTHTQWLKTAEHMITQSMQYTHNSLTVGIASVLTRISDPKALLLLSLTLGIALRIKYSSNQALKRISFPCSCCFMIVFTLKHLTNRLRPDLLAALLGANTSFPSGHTALAYVVWLTLKAQLPTKNTFTQNILAVIAIFTAFARVYITAHWLSDVLAGLIIAHMVASAQHCLSKDSRLCVDQSNTVNVILLCYLVTSAASLLFIPPVDYHYLSALSQSTG